MSVECHQYEDKLTEHKHECNAEWAPDSAIFEKLKGISLGMVRFTGWTYKERHHRMWCGPLPQDPCRNHEYTDGHGGDDLGLCPRGGCTSSDSEGDKNEAEYADHENHTDNIELPKQGFSELPTSMLSEWRWTIVPAASSLRLVVDPPEC